MGKARFTKPLRTENMIDTTNKYSVGGVGGDIDISKKSQVYEGISRDMQKKSSNINLGLNLPQDTDDSEDNESSCLSEDENDGLVKDTSPTSNGKDKVITTEELTTNFKNLDVSDRGDRLKLVIKILLSMEDKYMAAKVDTNLKEEDLKARGHVKSAKKPKDKPYTARATSNKSAEHPLLLAVVSDTDFHKWLQQFSMEEIEKMLFNSDEEQAVRLNNNRNGTSTYVQQSMPLTINTQPYGLQGQPSLTKVTHEYNKLSALTQPFVFTEVSNGSTYSLSPQTSPYSNNSDLNDSSYETGSPCSSGVTSPGSPAHHFSLPRTSISSESDYELDIVTENRPMQKVSNTVSISPAPTGREVKPIGQIVESNPVSATQRLFELSKSTSECVKYFTIELVRAVMTTKHDTNCQINVFCKNLMDIMKTKVEKNKKHIWKLSIYAHIQFLVAQDRVLRYRPALQSRDSRGRSLLYIAAVEHNESPIIARYIAESMFLAQLDVHELYEEGNTILHVLAEHGDSHVHVLSELLMATNMNKPLFSVSTTNNAGQTPLHVAVQSSRLHLSTVLHLLRMRACPFQKDKTGKSVLHYQILRMVQQQHLLPEEMALVRKMLQSPVSIPKESCEDFQQWLSHTSIPRDLSNAVLQEIHYFTTKDLRPKRNK